jgi:hypothetical protein
VPVAVGQTFGVEIELTSPSGIPPRGPAWGWGVMTIIQRLREAAGAPVYARPRRRGARIPRAWHVKYDSSAGWEVVSPVLAGAEGFHELRAVCDGLTALVAQHPDRLHVNYRTGLHVTLGTRLNTDDRLRGFLSRAQRVEPGLFTLVGPSRLFAYAGRGTYRMAEGNFYCRPLRFVGETRELNLAAFVGNTGNRYYSINLTHSHDDIQKLEVRLHGGTTEFRKVALWLSLWMALFNRSRYDWSGPGRPGPVFPGGNRPLAAGEADREDIVKLLLAEGIPLTADFTKLLKDRRRELREAWRKVLPLRVAAWEEAGWYDAV